VLFVGLLVAAMAAATFTVNGIGVLAPHLLPAFGIGRGALGLVVSAGTVTGAALSPVAGRVVDRMGARRSMVVAFVTAASAYGTFAAATRYPVMLVGGVAAGVALAIVNPATNKAIAHRLQPGRRATVTGIKQAGANLGFFAGALVVPVAAAVVGWRVAQLALGAVAVAAVPMVVRALPHDQVSSAAAAPDGHMPEGLSRALGLYALLLGFANSTVYLLPLYTVEELGVRAELAGFAVSVAGFAAVAGRIWWTRTVEARGEFGRALQLLAAGAAAAYSAILVSPRLGGWWLLGLAAIVIGLTASSWQPVAMLALMQGAGDQTVGTTSGRLMLGFYLGLGLGPPIQGFLVDRTGGYIGVWLLSMVAALLGCVPIQRYRARNSEAPVEAPTPTDACHRSCAS
jgi:predicted MFS family arabinose efflux permease